MVSDLRHVGDALSVQQHAAELRHKLHPSIRGEPVRDTEPGHPASQEGGGTGRGRDGRELPGL